MSKGAEGKNTIRFLSSFIGGTRAKLGFSRTTERVGGGGLGFGGRGGRNEDGRKRDEL